MQTESSNLAEQQKETIKRLESSCDSLQCSTTSLQSQLSESHQRESELESQISWEKLQHDNLVTSLKRQLEEKDVKLIKLQKDLETNVCVANILKFNYINFFILERGGQDPGPCEAIISGQLFLCSGHNPRRISESEVPCGYQVSHDIIDILRLKSNLAI